MIKIGCRGPHFRVPGLVEGNLVFIDSARLRGRCFTLSFLPPFGPLEYAILQHEARAFEQENVPLLAVMGEGALLSGPWRQDAWPRGLIPVSDPLRRLARTFGVLSRPAGNRCHSFVTDPTGVLQYHLVHDLNASGIAALLEIVTVGSKAKPPRAERHGGMSASEASAGGCGHSVDSRLLEVEKI
jgi:alkyl hydroperoxide reductase subunit AhpC